MTKKINEEELKEEIENEEDEYYYVKPGYGLGFICGLFTILGLIGGFLYPVDSEQREQFITGWKFGFITTLVITTLSLICFLVKVANNG